MAATDTTYASVLFVNGCDLIGINTKELKSTQYFLRIREKLDRRRIKIEWIEDTIENPVHTEVQSDGRIRKWKKIEEEDKFLRVILLEDGETVHNAFFDRSFKGAF